MKTFRIGTRGAEVKLLQRFLNLRMPETGLREDGVFNPGTHLALVRWQESESKGAPVEEPGIADAAIFRRLGLRTEIEWFFEPFAGAVGMSLWTSTYLLLLRERHERRMGEDRLRQGMIWRLAETQNNVRVFASLNRLRILSEPGPSPMPALESWMEWLQQGPVIAIGAGHSTNNRWEHACLVYGVLSDENPDGSGTVFRIHDPWAPLESQNYGATYSGNNVGTPQRRFSWEGVALLAR